MPPAALRTWRGFVMAKGCLGSAGGRGEDQHVARLGDDVTYVLLGDFSRMIPSGAASGRLTWW